MQDLVPSSARQLHQFVLEQLNRIVEKQPSDFRCEQTSTVVPGHTITMFESRDRPGRAVAFNFEARDGFVDVFQLTTVDGDPLVVERPARRIDSGAPTSKAAVIDAICWVLVGGAASP